MNRTCGILMHVSSLPAPWGIGDLGPLAYRFVDMLAEARQRCWQLLPLNPTRADCGESPYFSDSAFAGNPLLISPELLVREGLLKESECVAAGKEPGTRIDFHPVRIAKTAMLERAFNRFRVSNAPPDYSGFCEREAGWLDDYALFVCLRERCGPKAWNRWPDELKNREPRALDRARDECRDRIDWVKWCQYVFFKQWAALKACCGERDVRVIGDIPIYVSYDSADVWTNPGIFKLDKTKKPVAVSGVPPDYFSETGQLWNNPVYDWNAVQKTGYRWWIDRMGAMFDRFDIVRIDHFRGLVQYWEVPAGEKTAINGSWQDVPTYEFFDTLREHFPAFPVIAEDLGIITPDVVEVKEHYGFPGMKVLQFAFGNDNTNHPYLPHRYERACVAYTGTHDNDTLLGWWNRQLSREERERVRRYLGCKGSARQCMDSLIRLTLMSVADTAIIPLQDWLGLPGRARMNNPATARGNWRWRCTPREFDSTPLECIRKLADCSGRAAGKS